MEQRNIAVGRYESPEPVRYRVAAPSAAQVSVLGVLNALEIEAQTLLQRGMELHNPIAVYTGAHGDPRESLGRAVISEASPSPESLPARLHRLRDVLAEASRMVEVAHVRLSNAL